MLDFTSPLMGEVAAKLRVGVIVGCLKRITPPRHFVPTLPIKGRVNPRPSRSSQ
jgi:hypothetical protein